MPDADVIFVFDQEKYEQVTRTYPQIRQRGFLLGTLCPGDSLLIDDPWGLEAKTFGECYRRIAKAGCLAEKIPTSERRPVAVRQLSQRL